MTITVNLNPEQTQLVSNTNQQQAQAIANAATAGAIAGNQFVFFAAFDGTNNTLNNDPKANPQRTNVAQLWLQYDEKRNGNSQFGGNYYAGPGTPGTLTGSSWLPPQVTQQVINKAEEAYTDFIKQASTWLQDHPGSQITVALTSFSRGDSSAAIFSQMLYARGLIDPTTREVLIAPGQIKVSAGVIFDPVTTGVAGNIAFAPNVSNVVDIAARNEYRYLFKATDYRSQPGVTTIEMLGNHCDIGGGYDNGIGALSLQAATAFFQRSGLMIGDVPVDRQFNSADVVIHSEELTDSRQPQWSVYNRVESFPTPDRLFGDQIVTPATATLVVGGVAESLTLYDGSIVTITQLDDDSERVELKSISEDGSIKRVIHDYHGIGDGQSPEITGDEIVIEQAAGSTRQNATAEFFVGGQKVVVDLASANGDDGIKLAALTVEGIGKFTAAWEPDGMQDEIDASVMETDVQIDLSGGEGGADGSGDTRFYIGASASGAIENAKSGSGKDALFGNGANNILESGAGADTLHGGDGADTLVGGTGNDQLKGGIGNDKLDGGQDVDSLYGDAGGDVLNGGDGNDEIYGGDDGDTLYGDGGDDSLYGGAGSDYLAGGDGYDVYTYKTDDGFDTLTDGGTGKIIFNNVALSRGDREKGDAVYKSRVDGHSYQWDGGDLTIDNTIVVQNFQNGSLGIYLYEEEKEDKDRKEIQEPVTPLLPVPPNSPLILDLDGNGVTTRSVSENAYFDHEGDGFAERTGWVSSNDGLLVLDKNGNGSIDNRSGPKNSDIGISGSLAS